MLPLEAQGGYRTVTSQQDSRQAFPRATVARRGVLAAGAALLAAPLQGKGADITVGITSNTRPDWAGGENFLKSIREASEVGYHWIETFWPYVSKWENRPEELSGILAKLDLKMETVSNGGDMNTRFQDPTQHKEVIDDHMRLVRFIKKLDCDHLKINCGPANPGGNNPAIYRNMAAAFNELGRRISDMGIKFGVHHHLWNQYEKREDVDAIMELTDPRHVHMILDTGHTTMAGMDALQLTRDYVSRIIEFHMKDCAPEHRGGYKGPYMPAGSVNTNKDNLIFFPLGKGGVDFPGIKQELDAIGWKGWMTVELDMTATTAKDSSAVSKKYLEEKLGLTV
jgi:inosose dehydratase